MPLDLSDVALDSDLGESVGNDNAGLAILRTTGTFGAGGWIANAPQTIPAFGTLTIAGDKALRQFPEGDRVDGSILFVTTQPIHTTSENQSAISDKILWHGTLYRVQAVGPWSDNGFYAALLLRMPGQ
jgi:hypothetical protein